MGKNKGGRPFKYTDEVGKRIIDLTRGGVPLQYAAQAAGVHGETVKLWLREAAEGKTRKAKVLRAFADEFMKAAADSVTNDVNVITRHAAGVPVRDKKGNPVPGKWIIPPQWQAAAWKLERLHPKEFGRKDRVTVELNHDAERYARAAGLPAGEVMSRAIVLAMAAEDMDGDAGGGEPVVLDGELVTN